MVILPGTGPGTLPRHHPATTTLVAAGDVSAVSITHGHRRLIVTVAFRDLENSGPTTLHDIDFKTSTGKHRDVEIAATKGAWYGKARMVTPAGKSVHCSGMHHTIDYVKNRVVLTVPRACLGRPRWVEVAEGTVRLPDYSSPSTPQKIYADDAFSSYVSNNLHWSQKVHRG